MKRNIFQIMLASLSAAIIVGCAAETYAEAHKRTNPIHQQYFENTQQTSQSFRQHKKLTVKNQQKNRAQIAAVNSVSQKLHQKPKQSITSPQVLHFEQNPLNIQHPVNAKKLPAWMLRTVSVRAHKMPLNLLMQHLLGNEQQIAYDNTVSPHRLVSMDYFGPLKGALDNVASQTHYHYVSTENAINWSAFVTRTFNISFMPGSSSYVMRQLSNSKLNKMNRQHYTNLKNRLSIWKDLQHTLNKLKSADGKVIVSQSTTTVTVQDHPDNMRVITKYIANLNKTLSQEVAIRVQVLEIALHKKYKYGIDWNQIAHRLGTNFKLTGNLSKAKQAENQFMVNYNKSRSPYLHAGNSHKNLSLALLKALEEQGRLHIITRPQIITMNNQIASIRITQDKSYLQSVNSSFTEKYIMTSVVPGIVTSGFSLFLLPKIQADKIYLQISSVLSSLISMEKRKAQTVMTDHHGENNLLAGQYQRVTLELPTLTESIFNQRSIIHSGSTLVIAGFKRFNDAFDKTKSSKAHARIRGHSKGHDNALYNRNVQTVILITPTIIKSMS